MDPLSDVLSMLKPRTYMVGGFDVGGDWSIRFAQHEGVKCYAVLSGDCWLTVEGVDESVPMTTGDCFLMPLGRPFSMASDPVLTPVDAMPLIIAARKSGLPGTLAVLNGGGRCCIAGGHFAFEGNHAGILLSILPPVVHLRKDSDREAMRWSLERMRQELREPQPGSALVAQHLVQMLLVQALRLHLSDGAQAGVGWLFALADKQIGAAMNAMHDEPGHHWTLEELAGKAGMSRSVFAMRFKEIVGNSAMEYLTRWRMLLAGDQLVSSGNSIAEIALSLGYESESAFSTAFKRVMGASPRRYSRASVAAYGRRLEPVAG